MDSQFFAIQREMMAARFLLYLGARHSAVGLLKRVFRKSDQRDDTNTALQAAQLLRHHYSALERKPGMYRYYHQKSEEKLRLFHAESMADAWLEDLLYLYKSNRESRKSMAQKTAVYEAELNRIPATEHSLKLQHRLRFIQVVKYMTLNDYEKTAESCLEAISHFRRKPNTPASYIRIYLFQLIACKIQLELYEDSEEYIEDLDQMLLKGNSNWFKLKELQCILCLRNSKTVEARCHWEEAVQHPAFEKLYSTDREIWRIVEAFLHYLEQALQKSTFRLGRFLNEVPTLSQDKQGYNVTILVIQILFLLRHKKYDQIIDRAEAIEKYANRHLRGKAHRRSRYFIKMVLQLPKAGFHPMRLEKRVKSWQRKLENTPPAIARELHEIELVPYETLWSMILADLG
ncbi:MAG: hypothetical protein GYB31_15195 [Bacteroidetes bacterium]|nr:hypothetical protein [Bacteroidota bacterium]